jgi:hypothetical protein
MNAKPLIINPKYPNIHVKLVGQDSNAFSMIKRCLDAARDGGLSCDERKTFMQEATSGDYSHLLRTILLWFEVE